MKGAWRNLGRTEFKMTEDTNVSVFNRGILGIARRVGLDEFDCSRSHFYSLFILHSFYYVSFMCVTVRGVDHLPLSAAEVKNGCTPASPLCLRGVLRRDLVMSVLVSKGDIRK
jgi:hypothetical protein